MYKAFSLLRTMSLILSSLLLSEAAVAGEMKTYKVQNLCEKPVLAAVGWAVPYTGRKAPWVASGWKVIKPGQTSVLYRGKNDEIYVHVHEKGRKYSKPETFLHQTAFCVTPGKFYSKERIDERSLKREYRVGNDRENLSHLTKTCNRAGGQWGEGFFLVKSKQTWVYTCQRDTERSVASNQ